MKTVSFINLKGGVGKTTISTNLAFLLAESWNVKVLFLDNDKQGNASNWFNADISKGSLTNILMDEASAKEVIQKTRYPNIDIIASDIGLIDANAAVIKEEDKRQDDILYKSMQEVLSDYQICIVDNPPDINFSVFNAFVLTDDVIVVTTPEVESLAGVYRMHDQLRIAKQYNPFLRNMGILFNMYISSSITYRLQEELENRFPVFHTHIRFATPFAKGRMNESRMIKKSIFEIASNTGVARDLFKFSVEFMEILMQDSHSQDGKEEQ